MKQFSGSAKRTSSVYHPAIIALLTFVVLFSVPLSASAFSASPAASTAAKILLRPANTSPGKSEKVTGEHFTASATALVTFNGATVASGITINSTGDFMVNFTVPSSTGAGTYVVTAKDTSGVTASDNLVVSLKSKIKLTTAGSSRIVGAAVAISGTEFNSNVLITVTFNGVEVASTTSNSAGAFQTTFTAPQVAEGSYTVEATDGTNSATASFTIDPHLTSNATSVSPGQTITVTGTGFAATSKITFELNNAALSTTATSNSTGTFIVTLQIPTRAASGGQSLTATDASSNSASTRLKVS